LHRLTSFLGKPSLCISYHISPFCFHTHRRMQV
jgi:hypothetical protein